MTCVLSVHMTVNALDLTGAAGTVNLLQFSGVGLRETRVLHSSGSVWVQNRGREWGQWGGVY